MSWCSGAWRPIMVFTKACYWYQSWEHCNVMLPFMHRSPKWSLFFISFPTDVTHVLPIVPSFNHANGISWRVGFAELLIMWLSPGHCSHTPSIIVLHLKWEVYRDTVNAFWNTCVLLLITLYVLFLITSSYVNLIILILLCIIETESVKPLIQSDVSDSRSKLYQVEITGPVIEPAESGSVVYQIKKYMEESTRGSQEELIGDMLVAVLKYSIKFRFYI